MEQPSPNAMIRLIASAGAAWIFIVVGIFALSLFGYLLFDLVRPQIGQGFHDGGSNNLGPGLALGIYAGACMLASLLALVGSAIGADRAPRLESWRKFRIAGILNLLALLIAGLLSYLVFSK